MLTIIETICVDGSILPPFIFHKGKNMLKVCFAECKPSEQVAVCAPLRKRWTDTELSQKYLIKIYESHTATKYVKKYKAVVRLSLRLTISTGPLENLSLLL